MHVCMKLVRECDEVRQQHCLEVSELTQKHQQAMEDLRATHAMEVKELRSKWQAEVTEVKERGQTEVAEVREHGQTEVMEVQNRLEELKRSHELEIEEIERKFGVKAEDGSQDAAENVHANCEKTIADLTAAVEKLKQRSHELEIEDPEKGHGVKIDQTGRREIVRETDDDICQKTVLELASSVEGPKESHHELENEDPEKEHVVKIEETSGGEIVRETDDVCQKTVLELASSVEGPEKSREVEIVELKSRGVEAEERSRDGVDVHASCQKTIADLTASVEGLKSSYEKKILELTARLSELPADQGLGGDEMQLSLLLDDYLPVQRHEDIVNQLRTALRTVSYTSLAAGMA